MINNKKISNVKNLLKTIGSLKLRSKKIILCHGVFDVVHPGHIRHLLYAKNKADILVVSLTADRFIKKGIYRPHIPEDIRALNLSAFEMVDYVLIDNHEKPNELIKSLQPNYFAKGFEYGSSGLPIATKEEKKIVESYGGKMIFTPGDIVYSSTKLLDYSLPNIHLEKLAVLMKKNKISFDFLRKIIKKFSKQKVFIIGDTIVDTYTRTNFIGGQTKTPTFSVLYQDKKNYVGGAAVVALHLKAAGAKVEFSTVLGNDELKNFVKKNLLKAGVKLHAEIDSQRPTTNKNLIISKNYRLLKIDTIDNRPIRDDIAKKMIARAKRNKFDCLIFSDFRHGIFNKLSLDIFLKTLPKKIFKVADSQVASRWGNILEFKNFDLITPNEREARFSLADQDSTVGNLCYQLLKKSKCKNLIIKLSERGLFASTNDKKMANYFSLDSFAKNISDPVGAGDALLAYSSLTLKVSNSLVAATIIGSIAAACECEIDGNEPINSSLVLKKMNEIEKQLNFSL